MVNRKLEKVIEQVAKQYNTTPQEIRAAMQASLDDAMSTTDPAAKAKWNASQEKVMWLL